MEILNIKESDKITECKGLFWRGSENTYLSSHNSIETRKSLRFLKRKSCAGCSKCEWFWEFLQEDIQERNADEYLPNIMPHALYTYNLVTSQGYFDAVAEVEYLEFIEIKE